MRIKIIAFVILLAIIVFSCFGCNRGNITVLDYYGECSFSLPFELQSQYYVGHLVFQTEYSMEQMVRLIIEAGYDAELYKNSSNEKILISIEKNEIIYYFVIDTLRDEDVGSRYALKTAALTVSCISSNPYDPYFVINILAPIHLIDASGVTASEIYNSTYDTVDAETGGDVKRWRFYGSFNDLADFYRRTGKDDFEINEADETVTVYTSYRQTTYDDLRGKIVEDEITIRYIGESNHAVLVFESSKHGVLQQ